jgi:hypothetical protein
MRYSPANFGTASGEGIMSLEGAWNIADGFTKIKTSRVRLSQRKKYDAQKSHFSTLGNLLHFC